MSSARLAVLMLFAVAAVSCSPTAYKEETRTFARATNTAAETFKASHSAASEAVLSSLVAVGVSDGQTAFTTGAPACGAVNSAWQTYQQAAKGGALTESERQAVAATLNGFNDCRIEAEGGVIPFGVERPVQARKALRLVDLMADYASGLAELAGAQDIDAVDAKTADLRKVLESTFKTLNDGTETSLSSVDAFVEPVTATAQWLFTNYLNTKRVVAMRNVVREAHPLLVDAEPLLSTQLLGFALQRSIETQRAAEETLNIANDRSPGAEPAPVKAAAVFAAADAFDDIKDLARTDPGDTFAKMVDAHAALKEALENPRSQRDALIAALRDFVNHARGLKDALGA